MDKIHTGRGSGEYFCLALCISDQIIVGRHCQSEYRVLFYVSIRIDID